MYAVDLGITLRDGQKLFLLVVTRFYVAPILWLVHTRQMDPYSRQHVSLKRDFLVVYPRVISKSDFILRTINYVT